MIVLMFLKNFDLGANRIYFYSNKTSFIYTYPFISIIPRYISSLGMFELNGIYTYLLESYYVSPELVFGSSDI